jgi:hypothetical protein
MGKRSVPIRPGGSGAARGGPGFPPCPDRRPEQPGCARAWLPPLDSPLTPAGNFELFGPALMGAA